MSTTLSFGSSKKTCNCCFEVLHVGVPKEFYSGTPSVPRLHFFLPYVASK